jgi:hypothetical protein
VRVFNGVDDQIILAPGNLVGWTGAGMWAALVKRTSTAERTLCSVRTAAHSVLYTASDYEPGVSDYITSAGFTTVGQAMPTEWALQLTTKAPGTAVPRFHSWRSDTDLWAHADYGTAMADVGPLAPDGEVCLGNFASSLWYQGLLAVAGCWADVPDDATIEAAGLQLALANWLGFGTPLAVWALNRDPLVDLTGGGADQTAISGTTMDLIDLPPGFTF